MIKELDKLSKQYKQTDVKVISKDVSMFQNDLKKLSLSFVEEAEKVATKNKLNNIKLIAVIHE